MSAIFSKLFTLFLFKITQLAFLHCVVKFQWQKLCSTLTWYENAVPQLQNCVALKPNQKVDCGSCAALQKLKKLDCTFCIALLLDEKIVALCCAVLLV